MGSNEQEIDKLRDASHKTVNHVTANKLRITELEKENNNLQNIVKEIKDNDLAHIKTNLATVQTDVDWLKKFFWIVASASIGSLIASIASLIFK